MNSIVSLLSFPLSYFREEKDSLITPDEQLKRLKEALGNTFLPELTYMIQEYAFGSIFSNWHKALSDLKLLDEKIPPLPNEITEKIDQFRVQGLSPILYYVPGGTLNDLIKQAHGFALRFDEDLEQYSTIFVEPHWVLISEEGVPETYGKSFIEQQALLKDRNAEWDAPSLYSVVAAICLHRMVTGERLYGTEGWSCSHTRVKEQIGASHLIVGDFSSSGLRIEKGHSELTPICYGMAACIVFF